jgi:hypothetical protein
MEILEKLKNPKFENFLPLLINIQSFVIETESFLQIGSRQLIPSFFAGNQTFRWRVFTGHQFWQYCVFVVNVEQVDVFDLKFIRDFIFHMLDFDEIQDIFENFEL